MLSNAQICEFPIVYCYEGFNKLTGYNKPELMQKSSTCSFMWGDLTDEETKVKINNAFKESRSDKFEILVYKKSSNEQNYKFQIEVSK